MEETIHESSYKGLSLAFTGGNDPLAVGRPLQVVDPAGEDTEFVLEDVLVVPAPDPDCAGDVGRRDPLAVGREPRHRGLVGVLPIDDDLEGAVEVPDDDGPTVAVDDGVCLGIAGNEDPLPSLRRRHAGIRLQQVRRHLPLSPPSQDCRNMKEAGDVAAEKQQLTD